MLIGTVKCELCGKSFKEITYTHVKKEHNMHIKEYVEAFPDAPLYNKCVSGKEEGKNLLLDALQRSWKD